MSGGDTMPLTPDIAEALRRAQTSLKQATTQVDKAAIRRYIDRILDQAGFTK